jgi:hypothetical protein
MKGERPDLRVPDLRIPRTDNWNQYDSIKWLQILGDLDEWHDVFQENEPSVMFGFLLAQGFDYERAEEFINREYGEDWLLEEEELGNEPSILEQFEEVARNAGVPGYEKPKSPWTQYHLKPWEQSGALPRYTNTGKANYPEYECGCMVHYCNDGSLCRDDGNDSWCDDCRGYHDPGDHFAEGLSKPTPTPYMACPNNGKILDPLEGCRGCNSVGYHVSIPNPEFYGEPVGC